MLWGIYGNDHLIGNGGDDLLSLNRGNGILDGGSGVDSVTFINGHIENRGALTIALETQGAAQNTGAGLMTLISIENLSGAAGNDVLTGDAGDNILAGNVGSDILVGGAGSDTLLGDGDIGMGRSFYGSSGPITIWEQTFGVPGADVLDGGDGDDILVGGGGADLMTGGAGADIFKFLALADSTHDAADLITDFDSSSDILDLSAIEVNSNVEGHQAFTFVNGAFSGSGGEAYLRYDGRADTTHIFFDVDGDKVADMTIDLAGHFQINAPFPDLVTTLSMPMDLTTVDVGVFA